MIPEEAEKMLAKIKEWATVHESETTDGDWHRGYDDARRWVREVGLVLAQRNDMSVVTESAQSLEQLKSSLEPKHLLERIGRAKRFPTNTDPCSRHLEMIARGLLGNGYAMLQDEPEHCAVTMLVVLESLYKARNRLAKLESTQSEA